MNEEEDVLPEDMIPETVHCTCGFDGTAEDLEWDDDSNGLCPYCGRFL